MSIIIVTWCIIPVISGTIFQLNASEYERMPPLFALDEYEACLSQVGGAYCLVKADLFDEKENQLMRTIEEYSKLYPKHYNHTYIERGVCVTQTCQEYNNSNFIENSTLLSVCLNDTVFPKYGVQTNVSKVYYCDKYGDETRYDHMDWFVLVLCSFIVLINFIGTTYDYLVNRVLSEKDLDVGKKVITSFSIIRNWRWLVSAEPEEDRIKRLKGLHGIRSFTNITTILAHATWILSCGFTDKTHEIEKTYEAPYYQVLYNGLMIVQIFFVISGFLLVYHFRIQAEKNRISWMMIPQVMFVRWWRLSPALGVMLAFTSSWLRHLGSGPLWNHFVTTTVVRDCRIYWWYHLLYINNYAPEDKFCLIQTWHISADTQMFLVGLSVIIATQHHSRWRNVILGSLLVLGIVFPALHVYFWDLDGVTLLHPEFYRTMYNDTFRYLHVFGHTNLSAFIIGMFVAELIYDMQQKEVDISNSRMLYWSVYLVIPSVVLLMYSGRMFYADGPRASLALRMFYAAVHRPIMGLLVALGLIAEIFQCKNPLRPIFEWQGWVIPSRLSYSMYLIHLNLIYIFMGIRTELEHVSFYYLIICFTAFVGLSFIFAMPFFLLVEAPMNRLLKTLLDLGKSGQGEVRKVVIDKEDQHNTRV